MHIHETTHSITNRHIYIRIIYITLHTRTGFLNKNYSHLNRWQSHRQLCIQKKWRSVENKAMPRGVLQPRQLVSARDNLHPPEKQRYLLPAMAMTCLANLGASGLCKGTDAAPCSFSTCQY